jgi:hypothetical protein
MANEIVTAPTQDLAVFIEKNGSKLTANDITKVDMPRGGATTFAFDTPEGVKKVDMLEGVIIFRKTRRACFKEAWKPGMKERPCCASRDGENGYPYDKATDSYGAPIACATCPKKKFHRDENGGLILPDCSEHIDVLLLTEHELFPMYLKVRAASLQNVGKYFNQLTKTGRFFFTVRTRIEAKEDETKTGQTCTRLVPTMVGVLSPEEAAKMEALNTMMEGMMDFAPEEDEE